MPFKIATWNINSVRLRIGLVERFLEEHAPDVLCLQEIKCVNDAFPAKAFRKAGYGHHAVHGQKGYHGVATVSKHPLRETASTDYCLMGDTRHVETVVETGFGPDSHAQFLRACRRRRAGPDGEPEIRSQAALSR